MYTITYASCPLSPSHLKQLGVAGWSVSWSPARSGSRPTRHRLGSIPSSSSAVSPGTRPSIGSCMRSFREIGQPVRMSRFGRSSSPGPARSRQPPGTSSVVPAYGPGIAVNNGSSVLLTPFFSTVYNHGVSMVVPIWFLVATLIPPLERCMV